MPSCSCDEFFARHVPALRVRRPSKALRRSEPEVAWRSVELENSASDLQAAGKLGPQEDSTDLISHAPPSRLAAAAKPRLRRLMVAGPMSARGQVSAAGHSGLRN